MSKITEKLSDALTQAPERIFDARALVGGTILGASITDVQSWIGIIVGLLTAIYVALGIIDRWRRVWK